MTGVQTCALPIYAQFEKEKEKYDENYGYKRYKDQEYYDGLKTLYDKELSDLERLHEQKKISDEAYYKKKKELTDAEINLEKAKLEETTQILQSIGDAFTAAASLVGEQTKAGKALAIAGATIDTYAAANKALADPTPMPTILRIAAVAGIILRGLSNVKKIASVQIPTTTSKSTGFAGTNPITAQSLPRRAQGGIINGPGGEISDSIPALLSDGEYVVNSRSTRVFRPLLSAINEMGNLPAFAIGGLVSKGQKSTTDNSDLMAQAVSSAIGATPIRTYVTAGEVSNQQQFDRIIKSRSLI